MCWSWQHCQKLQHLANRILTYDPKTRENQLGEEDRQKQVLKIVMLNRFLQVYQYLIFTTSQNLKEFNCFGLGQVVKCWDKDKFEIWMQTPGNNSREDNYDVVIAILQFQVRILLQFGVNGQAKFTVKNDQIKSFSSKLNSITRNRKFEQAGCTDPAVFCDRLVNWLNPVMVDQYQIYERLKI